MTAKARSSFLVYYHLLWLLKISIVVADQAMTVNAKDH